eukprot:1394301-Amorphochlora_amoeboformis.AAC.1
MIPAQIGLVGSGSFDFELVVGLGFASSTTSDRILGFWGLCRGQYPFSVARRRHWPLELSSFPLHRITEAGIAIGLLAFEAGLAPISTTQNQKGHPRDISETFLILRQWRPSLWLIFKGVRRGFILRLNEFN